MATDAVLLEDRLDILVERDRLGRGGGAANGEKCDERANDSHENPQSTISMIEQKLVRIQ
jgi:hypothetical protein